MLALRSKFTLITGFLLMNLALVTPVRAVTEIQPVTSPGGIKAWLVEDHTIPLISINFAFEGGSTQDEEGKAGTANLVSGLLDEGAGELEALDFQKRQQSLAMRMAYEAGKDNFFGTFQTLTTKRDESLELLKTALTDPRFDDEPVARVRRQIIASLERNAKDPNAIASRIFTEKAFGQHPYGRPVEGTLESVPAITTDDLHQYVKKVFARDNLTIAVVGDITAKELGPVLDEVFGALPEKAAVEPVPETGIRNTGETAVFDYPIPQSVIRFALPGVKRDDPDFIPAYVLNHILGGGTFSSRLFREVREERGLAYSVYSYLYALDHAGLLAGGVATKNEAAKTSLDVIRDEIRKLRENPPTKTELDEAKSYLKGSYQLRFDTSAKIARNLVGIQLEDLGIDYIVKRNDLIDAVTIEDLQRVAERILDPDQMMVTVVGQPQGVGG